MFKEMEQEPQMTRYRFGPFELELETGKLLRDGTPLPLTRRKFEMLVVLLRNAGQIVTKEELISQIWTDQVVDETNLTQQIYNLRRLLGEDSRQPEYIVTIPGAGYRFIARVQLIDGNGNPLEQAFPPEGGRKLSTPSPSQQGETHAATSQGSTLLETSDLPPASQEPAIIDPTQRLPWRCSQWIKTGRFRLPLLGMITLGLIWIGMLVASRREKIKRTAKDRPARISPLASLPGIESYPSFSPDGKFVAFTSDSGETQNEDIFIRLIGEGSALRLTTHPATDHQVTWSPDGLQLAFLRAASPGEENRRYRVMVMPALGGTEREIGRAWGGLDWSPNGRYLAISDFAENKPPTRIVLHSLESNERTVLTSSESTDNYFDTFPRFSPDGTRIAFARWSSDYASDLFVADIQTKQLKQLTFDDKRIPSLQWTPDGEEILFVSTRQGRPNIWRIPATGGPLTQVSKVSDPVDHIALSRDGKLLAYSQVTNDTVIEIHSLSSITRNKGLPTQPLCRIDSSRTEFSPRFSPDGSQIVFTSAQTGFDEIWIANADCSGQQRITKFEQEGVGSPRWSPDGRSIVFDHRAERQADIFTIHLRTREIQRLTEHPSADTMPVWSPDGEWIYFTSERKGTRQIWKVPAKGGAALQVSRNDGQEPMISSDNRSLFYNWQGSLYQLALDRPESPAVQLTTDRRIGRQWTLQGDWLYFVSSGENARQTLIRLNYRTQQNEELCSIQRTFFKWEPGLAVSPDGTQVAFSFLNHLLGDLMIVEDWQ